MKVTTLRISPDLWSLLQREAMDSGVSVSQYIREAALARAAAAVAARGEEPFEQLAAATREVEQRETKPPSPSEPGREPAARAQAAATEARSDAAALRAQSQQGIRHAVDLFKRREQVRPGRRSGA